MEYAAPCRLSELLMGWSDPPAWARLLDGTDCPMCEDAHLEANAFSRLVAELRQSFVRLGRNQSRRGYTVVISKRHVNELFEFTDDELTGYWRDVADAAAAVQRVFAPVKINYAVLGNLCPHVHCHILPQFAADDGRHVLDMADGEVVLGDNECALLLTELRRALAEAARARA
jgi:diadenosine tetraphosphate (Ap4A) HIT family hydrolase